MTEVVSMHRAFLAEVLERRARLRAELEQLDAVEQYHQRIVEELAPIAKPNTTVTKQSRKSAKEVTDMRLLNAMRHEACLVAIQELGGRAKTQQIADWLRERGYGLEFDDRIFHNTCYTAMHRKPELFQKGGPGEWKLVT